MANWLARANAAAGRRATAANDSPPAATPEQADELRDLLAIIAVDWPDDERADALAAALADAEAALTSLRLLAAGRIAARPTAPADNRRRNAAR